MPKIKKRTSIVISLMLAIALIGVLAVMMILLPFIIEDAPMMYKIYGYFAEKSVIGISGGAVFWCWFYAVCLIAEICCAAIVLLLMRVRRKLVFSPISVSIIRFVSWGCIMVAFACLAVTYYFHMAGIVALVFGFLGLCVRVIKNVLEEAISIKDENDLTV